MYTIVCGDSQLESQIQLKQTLVSNEYNVKIFGDSFDLINELKEIQTDLIILCKNLEIPDAFDVCKEVRLMPQCMDTPIIFIDDEVNKDDVIHAITMGADEYLLKSDMDIIVAKISYLLLKSSIRKKQRDQRMNIFERYKTKRVLGSGGTSKVYLAVDTYTDIERLVALKIYNNSGDMSQDLFRTLFLREAYEWSKLDHPNIVSLFDFGHTADGCFISLEFIDGQSIADHLSENGQFDEETCKLIGFEIVRALQYLHTKEVIHRDLKPANVLISLDGNVKVTDFGLAKQLTDSEITLQQNLFRGSPHYVSPEQIEGIPCTTKSDIYSLGATLYHMCTGNFPFQGNSVASILRNNLKSFPRAPHLVDDTISVEFSELIMSMMQKDPNQRADLSQVSGLLKTKALSY